MKCPFCSHNEDKVIDSRETSEGAAIRRRRECLNCGRRFTTYEYVEKTPLMVIKKDGRREPFNREKILSGLLKACQKRPISMDKLEKLVGEVEQEIQKKFDQEVESKYIGELVIEKLSRLDDVAYVRFASVYRQFKDINQFMRELREILSKRIK
jgi:transcriptional repressor NrdR